MLKVKLLQKQNKKQTNSVVSFWFDLTSIGKNLDTFLSSVSGRIAQFYVSFTLIHFVTGVFVPNHTWEINLIENTFEPGYNEIGLCDISNIAFTSSLAQINPSLLATTLYSPVITTLVYNVTKYSLGFMKL